MDNSSKEEGDIVSTSGDNLEKFIRELHRLTTCVKIMVMKNTDCCIIINREQDGDEDTGKQYMGFKLEKFRGKPNKDRIYLFLHPFDEHNQILLTPDIDGKPLSRLSMEDFNPMGVQRTTGRADFTDPKEESENKFLEFCSSLGEDYEDSFDSIVDVCKNADDAIKEKRQALKLLEDKEKELRTLRMMELTKIKAMANSEGYISIYGRTTGKSIIKDGFYHISRRQKVLI